MPELPSPVLRLLIDACPTPAVVLHLREALGLRADLVHVDRVLPSATSDAEVLSWAAREARLIITANEADFLILVKNRPGHPGLGLINDQDTRARQIAAIESLVRFLFAHVDAGGTLVDHLFVLRRTGRTVVRRFPPTDHRH